MLVKWEECQNWKPLALKWYPYDLWVCIHSQMALSCMIKTKLNWYSYGHLLVITGYFYGIIPSINGVFLVLITGILGHNCRNTHWIRISTKGPCNDIPADPNQFQPVRGAACDFSTKRAVTVQLRPSSKYLQLWPKIPVISTKKTPFIECIIPWK